MAQTPSVEAVSISGVPGAANTIRLVGATVKGPPTSGVFSVGDVIGDLTGTFFFCTTAGTAGSTAVFAQIDGAATVLYNNAYLR